MRLGGGVASWCGCGTPISGVSIFDAIEERMQRCLGFVAIFAQEVVKG
jgi:hypothetical protein